MQAFQRGEHARRIATAGDGHAGGEHGILHLKGADQRQLDGKLTAAMRERDPLRKAIDLAPDELDVVAVDADGHQLETALERGIDHLPGIAVVDADHRRAAWLHQRIEQADLGGEIGLDARVIVEMVARQIGESADGNTHAVEPALVEAVRRGFQRQMSDALARQLIEGAMQFDRVRRGERAVGFPARRHHADGAEAGGGVAEVRPNLPGEGGDRGLAAGAGDGGDGSRLAREEGGGAERQRAARILDLDEGNIVGKPVRPLLGGDRQRARRCRCAGKMGAVGLGTGNGDEQVARLHLAAVRSNAGKLEPGEARVETGIFQRQLGEFHGRTISSQPLVPAKAGTQCKTSGHCGGGLGFPLTRE